MKKVTGYPDYNVEVQCCGCGDVFNVIEQDDGNEIKRAMFTDTYESCSEMDIEITCTYCDEEMILDKLEY